MQNRSPADIVRAFFHTAATADDLSELAPLVSENIDWYIAGDTSRVPWIGRKTGPEGVAEFYRQIREYIQSEKFTIHQMLAEGDRVVVLGELASRVKSTGKLIETEFVFSLLVEQQQISAFRLFEDSYAVSEACRK
ncbi:nuclear transport factor 2 family protein [Tatumella citrea]|uniref:SnoaL-like domain-containing protein n=1 Tax=Tatumella citrea TaxID=53336 RepID=A0A1Y0LK33_TATCI|nr:nuclear transport factor 2 family protein [Tatumella citrea]ARU94422.1 hypothetical protein A7K98_11975 [Tatumella citrea]ARU98461.1 hypothetical protein A7K99_11970 [Tatumella citrea]